MSASAPEMASKEELSVSMGVFLVSLVQEWYMGQLIVRSPKLQDASKPIMGLNLELTMKNSQVNVLPPPYQTFRIQVPDCLISSLL